MSKLFRNLIKYYLRQAAHTEQLHTFLHFVVSPNSLKLQPLVPACCTHQRAWSWAATMPGAKGDAGGMQSSVWCWKMLFRTFFVGGTVLLIGILERLISSFQAENGRLVLYLPWRELLCSLCGCCHQGKRNSTCPVQGVLWLGSFVELFIELENKRGRA